MIFTFSIRDFGHSKCLKFQFGHPVMKILSKSLPTAEGSKALSFTTWCLNFSEDMLRALVHLCLYEIANAHLCAHPF